MLSVRRMVVIAFLFSTGHVVDGFVNAMSVHGTGMCVICLQA